jgi:hypothetical protein
MIRKAVAKLQDYSADPLRELSLVSLNGEILIFRSRNEAVRALDGQSAFLFMDIGEVAREMAEVVTLKRPGQAPKAEAGFVA